jgi:hypothetical protein
MYGDFFMAIKSKSHENLTETNIQHVINLLDADTAITKKEACSLLNISYNTTRLAKIIEEHIETVSFRERRKAMNKGKGASQQEIRDTVRYYIDGDNVTTIAAALYRSPAFIKAIIERLGIPQKLPATDYAGHKAAMIPEQCVADSFEVGERVWYARKNEMAEVLKVDNSDLYLDKYGCACYQLWVLTPCDLSKTFFPHLDGSKAGYFSHALTYDLGSLKHLQEYL